MLLRFVICSRQIGKIFSRTIGYDKGDCSIMKYAILDVSLTVVEALQALEFEKVEEEGHVIIIPFLFE